MNMNYYDTLIEVADDYPASEAQVSQARGAKKILEQRPPALL
jgi:hypothetical protein